MLHKQKQQRQRKKFLHLVLNDWDRGYSIYRVYEEDFVTDDAGVDATRPPSLVARVVAQHARSESFAALGTKILAMRPADSSTGIPVFDTDTLAMTVCPCPQSRWDCSSKPLYACVGGRLVAFIYPFLEVLGPEPGLKEKWSWATPQCMPPFDSTFVSCYAVHPDGRTIIMSVKGYRPNPRLTLPIHGNRCSTFSFNTESLEWTHVGDWLLPFKGQAHYDEELDAWVGLFVTKENAGTICCCCDVPPATGQSAVPALKFGEDVFFDKSKRHLGATLVYMGSSRYCVVESRMPKDDDCYPRLRVVKITSFVLRYGN